MTKGFVDFGEKAEVLRPSLKTIFNGVVLDDALTDEDGSFTTLSASGRGLADVDVSTIDLLNYDGGHHYKSSLRPRVITVRYKISARSSERFRDIYNKLNDLLSEEEKAISFTDENAYFIGTYNAREEVTETSNVVVSSFSFICADPYKYYDEKVRQFPSDYSRVYNEGTAEASPIFELTATQKTTFAMISTQDEEYNMIGKASDDAVQAIDTRTSVLYENGSTLNQWQHTENREMISDDSNIDSLDGVMGTDGAGIRAQSYGTPQNRQRGPAIFKELSNPIQDFEIQSTFDIISRFEQENFRMMIYFLDENMNNIGHMGIKDNSRLNKRRVPLAQLGQHNQGVSVLGDSSPRIDDARDTTLMYLRAKREGQRFSFYIAHWRNQRHETVWNESYFDVNNEFQGRLKYITLFIGSYQDRGTPNRLRINSVEAFELKTIEEDQTPYILNHGDLVTFDHDNDEILVNGEDATSLKQFGGSYFKLRKGANDLIVLPEESFETKVKFKERSR